MTDERGASANVLEARGVVFTHGTPPLETRVLHGVDLDIAPGELTVLMGPSGSGKTTLISILAGLLRPTRGRVVLGGSEISAMDDAEVTAVRRRTLGFVFQAFHLFPALTATDNVAEVLALSGTPIRVAREKARALLTRFGLEARLDHRPGELSAGQRQRVAIARAIVTSPRLVIADEPTVALDGPTAASVMELLREYVSAGTSVVLVTHDVRLVRASDRVVALEDGRVAYDGRGLAANPHGAPSGHDIHPPTPRSSEPVAGPEGA
ncbi:MAG: ABC transporter ATP-binding protein [Sandaracinaceae bacterium]|nr:ABC transporter ATP-binding protein [Sandaracinaceae bacterium]